MQKARVELFIKKLYYANHPKSYNGNAIVDRFAAKKTYTLLSKLHDNGIDVNKYLEYNLLDVDAGWRYNVVMSAVQDGVFKSTDIKHIIAIDDFITGMTIEHPALYKDYANRVQVHQFETLNVDRYVKGLVVSAVDAMIQENVETGKEFKSCLNTLESVIARESMITTTHNELSNGTDAKSAETKNITIVDDGADME